jgi:hypothetical protein
VHRTRIAVLALLLTLSGVAQKNPAPAQKSPAPAQPSAAAPATAALDEETIFNTRRQLLDLIRISPRLAEVLSRDASLLSDSEYIQRKNPALARFLEAHPEISRNPEFFLFAGRSGDRLDDIRWNTETQAERVTNRLVNDAGPVLALLVFLFAAMWLLRTVMDNLRWRRVLHLQTDVHNKLLDKFGNSQELLAYMQTDAGKRFLEAAPISVAINNEEPQWRSPIVRIMRPLTAGIVLSSAGIALVTTVIEPVFTLGKVVLMLGIGFIISAGASWLIARQSGLLESTNPDASNRAL